MYTVKRCTQHNLTPSDLTFIAESAEHLNGLYEKNYNWRKIDIKIFATLNYLTICYRDETPVGFLAATFYRAFFDREIFLLQQNVLFSKPNTRAALLLLRELIDFGKCSANDVITMLAKHTNIKPRSLERLGFRKFEELYRLEL